MKIANRAELYKETVDVLFDAYFKGELKHGSCMACAVGNICLKASSFTGIPNKAWNALFITGVDGIQLPHPYPIATKEEAKKLIDHTGYLWKELARVEFSFETAPKGNSEDDYMFNGLEAVLEVLKEIHGVTDDDESLPRFQSHYKSLTEDRIVKSYQSSY